MDYCVYGLFGPKGLRYIGKTKTSELKNRLRCHLKERGRCYRVSWIFALKKANKVPTIKPLVTGLTEKEALSLEISLIEFARQFRLKLVNQTDGGDGISGYKHTKETRLRMSNSHKGKLLDEETKKKIGDAHKGKKWALGRHHSKQDRLKISQSNLKIRGKPVHQKNLKGKTLQTFAGIQLAARETNSNASLIVACCKNKRKTHNGFRWEYASRTKVS